MSKKLESFLFVLLYIACYFAANVLAVGVLPLYRTIKQGGNVDVFIYNLSRVQASAIYVIAASIVIALLMFWVIFRIRKSRKGAYIRTGRLTVSGIAAAVFITYGLNVVSVLIASLDVLEPFTGVYNTTIESVLSGNIWVVLLIVGFLAPMFEEIMYRGIILSEFSSSFPFFFANLFQALLFGIMHFNPIQSLYAAVIGFALGYVYKLSGTIYLTMLIHILFNASNVFSGLVPNVGITVLTVSALASFVLGYLLLARKR